MAIYNSNGTSSNTTPKQNFTDVGSNLRAILNRILKNDNLVKLIYYNDSSVSGKANLTDSEKSLLINDQIKIVPKLPKDTDQKTYLVIQMDQFAPVSEDTTFRSFLLSFDIICPADSWVMDDYMLRPFKIMQEIDSLFNLSKLHSLGPVTFTSANQIVINEDLMGYSMYYSVYDFQ